MNVLSQASDAQALKLFAKKGGKVPLRPVFIGYISLCLRHPELEWCKHCAWKAFYLHINQRIGEKGGGGGV